MSLGLTDMELADLKREIANGDHDGEVLFRRHYKPPCFCSKCCQDQYLDYDIQEALIWTYTGFRDPKVTTALAMSYTKTISKESAFLRQRIGSHGNKFVKWWRRWTVAERKGVLLRIRPNMYPDPHPLIDLGFRRSLTVKRAARCAYLLPYINLESLSAGYFRLVSLMHNRVRHNPETWVLFDNEVLRKAWWMGCFEEQYSEGCITMSGAEYGRWKEWNSESVHRGDAFGAPRAVLILEAQAELMKFLREIFNLAMGDDFIPYAVSDIAQEDMKTQSKWHQVVTAGLKAKHEQKWISFAETHDNQPFLAPPTFNIDVLIDIAENRVADAQDKLWLLRTEPSHFFDNAKYLRDSIPTQDEAKLYNVIANMLFHDPMINALSWRWIQSACHKVNIESTKQGYHIGIGSTLPRRYGEAMRALESTLILYTKTWTQKLADLLCMMPEFQTSHKVLMIGEGKCEMVSDAREGKIRRDLYSTDRILWCLVQLCRGKLYSEDAQASQFDYSDVLCLLDDYLAQCSHSEASRLDQTSYSIISDLAAAYQMLAMLKLHRPTHVWSASSVEGFKFMKETCGFKAFSRTELGQYIQPLDRFQKPKGKKDLAWLVHADAGRTMLDAAWKAATDFQAVTLILFDIGIRDLEGWKALMQQGQTAMYTPQVIEQRNRILARQKTPPVAQFSHLPMDETPQIIQGNCQSTRIAPAPQPKQKTRPNGPPLVNDLDQLSIHTPTPLEPDALLPIVYILKENSMQTMCKILPDAEDSTRKGTVDWIGFVSLMNDLGFHTEHRGGSAFTFKKAEIQSSDTEASTAKMSIVIHKPHPSSEMFPVMLKGIGRRFVRRFGWNRGRFQCAKEVSC
ncbi:MAG: hypothetical protein M1812_006515 [Candelaria pacifica]|nr:MAG: hypothetical protein M1812_006515 [Candelaria pacifica]